MNRDRFKDVDWFPNGETVVIGGQGGIGSWLALLLARIGYNIVTYDFDVIEEHNVGGQFFKTNDVGKFKTVAIKDFVSEFAIGNSFSFFTEPVGDSTILSPFMFSAFDNMEARKTLFKKWKESLSISNEYPIFIDGRLELEMLQIFCVRPHQIELYENEYLFDDGDVPELSCTLKQTSHTAAMIASHMTAFFTNHISNINNGGDIREIPFLYEYTIPFNLTSVL